jgi:hypothetical protein
MRNVPLTGLVGMHFVSELVNVQVPTAIPLLSVPTVPGDPLVVPVRPPSGAASVRTLLFVFEVTV